MDSLFDNLPPPEIPLETAHYYVDEAGDPTLFDRKGRVLIGETGCSKFFILGKLEVYDPVSLEKGLTTLRESLIQDPYFDSIPSLKPEQKKTALGFHATNDIPEIRWEVFKFLRQQEVRFYSVVKDKEEVLKSVKERNSVHPSYRYGPNELYDTLVTALFQGLHSLPDRLNIYFAKRGNSDRTKSLKNALENAEQVFLERFGFNRNTEIQIQSGYPPQAVCLQAVDYYLWALQRFYECREYRYITALWNQVGEIYDLDLREGGITGVYFRKGKPLNLDTRPLK